MRKTMIMPKIDSDYFPLVGGLDLQTPAMSIGPGMCFDAQNYEPQIAGGYRRIDGFERYSGQPAPSSANYWILSCALSVGVSLGATVTGATSGATGRVLKNILGAVVLGRVTGLFLIEENLTVAAVVVGTTIDAAHISGAALPTDDADYTELAADDLRADIAKVPGSGPIRGVAVHNDVRYAFRDNAGGTAGAIYKATTAGWVLVPFKRELQIVARSKVVTMTIAAPGVVSLTAHGAAAGTPVSFSSTGALPTGLLPATTYYVLAPNANDFTVAATVGGAAITTSGSQSGVHTATFAGGNINVGDTVTGVSSGATAVAIASHLMTGTWTVSPVGSLAFTTVTGAFTSGEALTVGGQLKAQSGSADTAITRAPGGKLDYVIANFTGASATRRMYGADGANFAFEFDGTNYLPIRTGMTIDTPFHIAAHRNYLFLSFGASVQYSGTGLPFAWTAVLGAGEMATGEDVSGMIPVAGNSAGSALGVFTNKRMHTVYGSSNLNFAIQISVQDQGYSPFTLQSVGASFFGLTARGIQSLITTLNYGDFDYASVSHLIQKFVNPRYGMEIASTVLRTKNQYRIYYSDGYGLAVGLTGDKVNGILPLYYGMPVRCMTTAQLSTGPEVTYFGSDDGYVYQDNIGTSFDGLPLEAWIRLAFNHMQSPRLRKRFRRVVLDAVVDGFSKVNFSYDLGYGSLDVAPPVASVDTPLIGGSGGYWDQFNWDQFVWDTQTVLSPTIPLDGTEKNLSIIFYSNRTQDRSHTVQGATMMHTPRRMER